MKRLALLILIIAMPAAAATDGAALYKAKCAMCHQGKIAPDLGTAEAQKLTDEQITEKIATGKKHEFKAKGMTDEQIKSLVAHIRTLKK